MVFGKLKKKTIISNVFNLIRKLKKWFKKGAKIDKFGILFCQKFVTFSSAQESDQIKFVIK